MRLTLLAAVLMATLPACASSEDSPAAGGADSSGGRGQGGASTGGAGAGGAGGNGAGENGADPVIQTVAIPEGGVSARFAFEDAYDNVQDGAWYRDVDNEDATLAWGESYVMMSLAAMFRATGSPLYLERLAWHIDGVLAQRDDNRGVDDYRGISGACWRNRSYQPANEPYCYVVHSGMLGYPLAEFARLVAAAGLELEPTADGSTFGDKAAAYITAAEQVVAYHDDQYNDAGYYLFRPDATFLGYPGVDLPLNQSNAMGRMLLALYDVTADNTYLDKATKLAQRMKAQISFGPSGEALWNYWGGAYSSPGEDISHAAINVDFAAMAAERGVVFGAADLEALAQTFMARAYIDDSTISDFVGGGSTDDAGYRPQIGRWLRLAEVRASVYAAVRDLFDDDYAPAGVGSGSVLAGWGYLAEQQPISCEHYFYVVDWFDPNTSTQGDWREATAYGANILTVPPNLDEPCVIPLEVDVPRETVVQQWDGNAYHPVMRWGPSASAIGRLVAYEPRWPHIYDGNGVLFQLTDAFVSGDGIMVRESEGVAMPQIDSSPPTTGQIDTPLDHAATGTGDGPLWWALSEFPLGARIDHASGALDFTPDAPGNHLFTIVLQSDWGRVEQSFTVTVP